MITPRDDPGLCAIGMTLYAFGGAVKFPAPGQSLMDVTNTVESLDLSARGNPSSAAWRMAPPLPVSNRTAPAVTSLPDGAGCVIVGGFFSSSDPPAFGYLGDAWHFDGTKYTRLPDLPYNRSNMGITATSDGVYVVGGGALNPAYYNVSFLARNSGNARSRAGWASSWTKIAPLNYARSYAMVSALADAKGDVFIVAAGGMSLIPFFSPMGSVEVYSPKENKWTLHDDGEAGALPLPIGFGGYARLNATHMLVAGGAGPGVSGLEGYIGALPAPSAPSVHLHTSASALYGLALVANSPSKQGLASFNPDTGAATVIGGAHAELFGAGDLVEMAHGALFYLGDTAKGATLVRLNLTDGSELCNAVVDMREIGYVGLGQSLDYDHVSDRLILSGIAEGTNTSQHVLYSAPATGCGPFTRLGSFGDAAYVPMLHASSYDAKGGRLFLTVGTSQNTDAVAVIDLNAGGKMRTIAEVPASGKSLVCMHWDPNTKRLFGVMGVGAALELHSLDPDGTGKWDPRKTIQNTPKAWNVLGGNDATVSAFDPVSRTLFLMAGQNDPTTGEPVYDLATIDVDEAVVLAHPKLAPVGMKGCTTCVMALTV